MADKRLIKIVRRRGNGIYVTYRCPNCGDIISIVNKHGDFSCENCNEVLNTEEVDVREMGE